VAPRPDLPKPIKPAPPPRLPPQDMQARDLRDRTRAAAPLKAAEDAVVLDTSSMSAEEVLEAALVQVRARCPGLSIRGS